jgi:hypothetical protein
MLTAAVDPTPGEQVGARVQRPNRVPKRGKNLPMSCAIVTEVQVISVAGDNPKLLPTGVAGYSG